MKKIISISYSLIIGLTFCFVSFTIGCKQKVGSNGSELKLKPPQLLKRQGQNAMRFETNNGQTNEQVKFVARGKGYSLFLLANEAVWSLRKEETNSSGGKNFRTAFASDFSYQNHSRGFVPVRATTQFTVLRMQFIGANPNLEIAGLDQLPGKSNYYVGADPENWHIGIPTYRKVQYRNIYPDIDLVFYGNDDNLEYDFVVAPNADPEWIRIGFDGAKALGVDNNGHLIIEIEGGQLVLRSPLIYQEIFGKKRIIAGTYALHDEFQVGFAVGDYDKTKRLIIDPELVYSTYWGGSSGEAGEGIAVDVTGNVYVTGYTTSLDFPTTNALQPGSGGRRDVFITVLNPNANAPIYSTFLGGSNDDAGIAIDVDAAGFAVITGNTQSPNFPVVAALQRTIADTVAVPFDGDAFVARLNPQGGLVYSTYLGDWDKDEAFDIAVAPGGDAYVTGRTEGHWRNNSYQTRFPLTVGAYKTTLGWLESWGYFVMRLNPAGAAVYSTLVGNSSFVRSRLAIDATGSAYVLRSGNYSESCKSLYLSVIELNAAGTTRVDSFAICSDRTYGFDIALDVASNFYLLGHTWTDQLSTTANAFQPRFGGGNYDAFFWKVSRTTKEILYATYLGGNKDEWPDEIVVDPSNNAYMIGNTSSQNFPIKNAIQINLDGQYADGFVTKIDPSLDRSASLIYSTFLGGTDSDLIRGIDVDAIGNAYVTGWTWSADFPTKNAFQIALNGVTDAIVARIGVLPPFLVYDQVGVGGQPVFTPLLPPATQQILPQSHLTDTSTVVVFVFEGRKSDGRIALRIMNTKLTGSKAPPLKLNAAVIDPEGEAILPFTLFNIGDGNFGIQFDVLKDGLHTIQVRALRDSPGPFPAPFQIHLAANVGLPRKRVNDFPEIARATRQDILFNHPAPRPQVLLGKDSSVAQAALFKFANRVSISPFAVAVLIPPPLTEFTPGMTMTRARDPNPPLEITTPTARTPELVPPVLGSIIDFTQIPIPASAVEQNPALAIAGTVAAVLGNPDGLGVSLPLIIGGSSVGSLILDMGSGQEIVNGDGIDFWVYARDGAYSVRVSNTPFRDTFVPVGGVASGEQAFDLDAAGLSSARYVRITAAPSVTLDAVKSLNIFADQILEGIGPVMDVNAATITMRRLKGPQTAIDPFLELIAPDGSRFAENESGFGDDTSVDLSDAALVNIDLKQSGFYRFLGRGYQQRPDEQAFGYFLVRLETTGKYDATEIAVSPQDELAVSPQKQGTISQTRQRDSFLFQAKPGQKINVVVNAKDGNLNPILELYDPEDFLISANDDYAGRGKNAVLSLTLPELSFAGKQPLPNPSTYRLVVSAIDQAGDKHVAGDFSVYQRTVAAGSYALKVFTGNLADGEPMTPAVIEISPKIAVQGNSDFKVSIKGSNFANGATVTFSGSGITVKSVNFVSSNEIAAIVDIAKIASAGYRDVTVTNPAGRSGTGVGLFEIRVSLGNAVLKWAPPSMSEPLSPPLNLTCQYNTGQMLGKTGSSFVRKLVAAKPKKSSRATFVKQKSISSTNAVSDIDEIEPNNDSAHAQMLTGESPLAVRGNVEVGDQGAFVVTEFDDDLEDLFRITTLAKGLRITLDRFTSDCDLYLCNSDMTTILEASNTYGATEAEEIDNPELPVGTYFVGVTIFDPDPNGPDTTRYRLTLWGQFKQGGSALRSYNIYRSTLPGAKSNGKLLGNIDANTMSFIDPAPYVGSFFYQVTAVYDAGESLPSNEVALLVTQVNARESLPGDFDLSPNYPNPFNPSTTIEFVLPKASFVTLKIYDLLGNEVATIAAETLPAGRHRRLWKPRGLASGVYVYRLEVSDPSTSSGRYPSISLLRAESRSWFVRSRKLVLLQ